MNKNIFVVSLVLAMLYFATSALSGNKVHWGYSGHEGPEYWGKLAPEFSPCSKGKNQSPVNITGTIESKLVPLKIKYKKGGGEVLNNGHAIQVNYSSGSYLTIGKNRFELKQFHFHSPSENALEGKLFPMEAHFVHADKKGNLAVIALFFNVGKKNKELEKAWSLMPKKSGMKKTLSKKINADKLLPKNRSYYRFNGSLTTPPCSEGVYWIVMKRIETVSKGQITKFTKIMHGPNNRPLQPINARMILK